MAELLNITEEDAVNLYSAIEFLFRNNEPFDINHPNIEQIEDTYYIKLSIGNIHWTRILYYNKQDGATVMFQINDNNWQEYLLNGYTVQKIEAILRLMNFIIPNSDLLYQRYKNMEIILGN